MSERVKRTCQKTRLLQDITPCIWRQHDSKNADSVSSEFVSRYYVESNRSVLFSTASNLHVLEPESGMNTLNVPFSGPLRCLFSVTTTCTTSTSSVTSCIYARSKQVWRAAHPPLSINQSFRNGLNKILDEHPLQFCGTQIKWLLFGWTWMTNWVQYIRPDREGLRHILNK